ncbi:kinesin-like protein KIF23 [Dendronephthya gigantea]|uniref:kinesin-like protein KIF23 n=1 Tax=Dendronephthya gigantea TaxID=151771 RepID=UPI001069F719|nr:kinesin-like protein KIF23 [Dendronephthya gigantea]
MKPSSTASPYPRKTPRKTPRKPSKSKPTDPVEVFCRIRPLHDNEEELCVEVVSKNTIQLNPPQNSQGFKSGHRVTATQHSFKQVFDEDSIQKNVFDTVALDIVHDLIHGKNGLIFAYGITGSGKTYTMTGSQSDGGLLPRGLDVLFNSIGGFQTKPCVFTPDKSNGMDVQSESDAKLDHDRKQKEMALLALGKNRGNDDDITDMVRVPDCFKFDDVDEDNGYAVFVSYVEIYNNFIYDLLEDNKQDLICPKAPVSKQLREDNNRNMYVQGVTEVEVKSTEEAYAMFWKGQKKRRVANTQLNLQSSRSHSVFTLKLVQAPLDPDGESVLLDKEEVRVSTLSMCDLAGSERTNRTKADGDRLKEAGNINKDLMNLRSCLEILRENQASADGSQTGKMVPYRESRLTHLFKNFFDGEGKVRMVVCLNPSAKEYDESVHVMRFAEITQEVVVARPTGINSNTGLAPGRRKANQMFKQALQNIKVDGSDGIDNPLLLKPITTFPPFPLMEMTNSEDCITLVNLLKYLQEREQRRATLEKDLQRKRATFRQELAKLDSQTSDKDKIINELQASNLEKEREIQKLERKLKMFSQKNDALVKTNQQHQENEKGLQTELDEQRKTISKEKQDRIKLKQTLKGVVTQERDKWQKECNKRVKDKELEMETKIIKSEEKLRQLKEIVYKGEKKNVRPSSRGKGFFRSRSPPPVAKKPPVKLRHRRSKSSDCWLEHKPAENFETETILRPVLKNKKTVNVPEEKHFKESQATNYVLEHQEADSQGELETKLIKGDIYKTTGGGRCVQFTDVETLKTNFDVARSPERKRSYPEEDFDEAKGEAMDDDTTASWTDVETRCAFGIEGRPGQTDPSIHHNAKQVS